MLFPKVIISGFEEGGTTLLAEILKTSGYESYFEIGVLLADTPKIYRSDQKFKDHYEIIESDIFLNANSKALAAAPEMYKGINLESLNTSIEGFRLKDFEQFDFESFESFYNSIFSFGFNNLKFFDKTPKYMSVIGEILRKRDFFEKYLIITRDPRAIFWSRVKRRAINKKLELPKEIDSSFINSNFPGFFSDFFKSYNLYAMGCISYLNHPKILFIKHEDLMNEPDKELGIIADFIQEKELFFPARDQVTSKDYKYVYQGVKKSTATEYNKFLKPDLCQFILDETAESAYFFNNENTKKHKDEFNKKLSLVHKILEKFNLPSYLYNLEDDFGMDPVFYLLTQSRVLKKGLNPWEHYKKFGKGYGFSPYQNVIS